MNTERLIRLIESDEHNNQLQKNILKGFVLRAEQNETERRKDREIIEEVGIKNLSEVILSTEDLKIYTIYGKDDWDIKYPYRAIFLENGKWLKINTISPSLDVAFLVYLEKKYLGYNSQFTDFALKMLGIKIEE